MKCEIKDKEQIVINQKSKQIWFDFKDFVPSKFSTSDIEGDYFGNYLCLVEREYKDPENIFSHGLNHLRRIDRSCELCYWNDLANKFQDFNRNWVNVTHWSPIPNIPKHNITIVSRKDMLSKLEKKEYELVEHSYEKKHNLIEGMWDVIKECALYSVPLKDQVFLSTEKDENDLEDVMWCIKI